IISKRSWAIRTRTASSSAGFRWRSCFSTSPRAANAEATASRSCGLFQQAPASGKEFDNFNERVIIPPLKGGKHEKSDLRIRRRRVGGGVRRSGGRAGQPVRRRQAADDDHRLRGGRRLRP